MSKKEFSSIPSLEVQSKNEKNRQEVAVDVDSGGKYTPIPEKVPLGITNGDKPHATEKHPTTPDVEFKKKGKDEKEDDGSQPVSFLQLFRYSDRFDKVLLVFGTLMAMCSGCSIPINMFVYGKVANSFIYYAIYLNFKNSLNTTAVMPMNSTQYLRLEELSQYADVAYEARSHAVYFCLIAVGAFVFSFLAGVCWNTTAERQMSTIRKKFFRSVMRQDMSWFDTHQSGEIAVKFTEDMHLIADGIGEKVATFVQWISTFLAAYIIAFYSGWKLALATFGFCPLVIFVGAFLVRMTQTISKAESDSYAKAGAVAEEALGSIRTVAAFNGQDKECDRYSEHLRHAKSHSTRKGIFLGLGTGVFWCIIYGAFGLAFWYGIKLMQDGEPNFEPGNTLIVFMGVMIGSMSLGQAFPTLEIIGNARGASQKVFHIIEQRSNIDVMDTKGDKPNKAVGNVEFKNVVFNYPTRPDVQVLQGLSLEVKVGQTVALVGASGCGKSTVIQLLQRFYDTLGGQVLVDGRNVVDLNVNWLRQQIGVVSQEPVLFATSIAENIRFGRLDVTQAEIEQAAKEANAHDFITDLPEGYETLVGERGAQLSGGQKQRIAIARALVRNPKILLLDEATSALDNESEGIVQRALEKAQQGRTTIVIAHRLSTVRNADVIFGILDGQVIEHGTHDQLMEKTDGLYSQLVTLQMQNVDTLQDGVAEELENEIFEEEDEEIALIHKLNRQTSHNASLRKGTLQTQKSVVSYHSQKINTEDADVPTEEELEKDSEELEEVPLLKVLRMNSPEWYLIIIACLGSAVAGCIQPVFAIVLAEFLKVFTLSEEEQNDQSVILVAYLVAIGFGNAFIRLLMAICFTKSGAKLTARFRMLAFKSMVWQDMSYFDDHKNRVGVLTTKLASDAALVQGATGNKIGTVLEALATVLTALTISFIYSWKLTLVIVAFLPLMMAAGIVHGRILKGFSKGDKNAMQEAGKICNEAIENIRTVASLTREQSFIDKFDVQIDKILSVGKKRSVIHALVYSFSQSIMYFAYAAAFSYGGYLIQYDGLSFEHVFRVFGAIVFGGMSVGRNVSYAPDYKKGKLAATRLFSIIELTPQIDASSKEGITMDSFAGDVELDHIKFCYPSRPDVQVLNDLSIKARPGETLALVGTSGCGKSTTVQLIERFYDPEGGQVMFDGSDVKTLNLQWLRSQIGIVSQEPVLFDTSIAENIAYGDNSRVVPMDDIIKAAREANIHSFVDGLPHGYETNVGDKGTQLSGGQKQRVAIARALLRNPKILLLDEATSALDSESERGYTSDQQLRTFTDEKSKERRRKQIVQEALDKARKGRTCVVIAHRLSTIQNADRIAIFSKGEVVELGSHTELIALKGIYYKLHQHNRTNKSAPE